MIVQRTGPDVAGPDGQVPVALGRQASVELDGSTGLYDTAAQRLVVLNPGAAAVWAACDGERGVAAIVSDLAASHGLAPADIETDVVRTVDMLAALGLVAFEQR